VVNQSAVTIGINEIFSKPAALGANFHNKCQTIERVIEWTEGKEKWKAERERERGERMRERLTRERERENSRERERERERQRGRERQK